MENTRGQIHSGLKTLAPVLATQIWQGFRMWQPKEAAISRAPTNQLMPSASEWGRGMMKRNMKRAMEACSHLQLLTGVLGPCCSSEAVSQAPARCRVGGWQQYPTLVLIPVCHRLFECHLGGKSISSPFSRTSQILFPEKKKAFGIISWVGAAAKFSYSQHVPI